MVSVSPRLVDNLDSDEEPTFPSITDPRFSVSSLTLEPSGYSDEEYGNDGRAFAGTPDPGSSRRKRRERESLGLIENAEPFEYPTVADGNTFRLAIIQPGTGTSPVKCDLVLEEIREPRRAYKCLSYAWESINREAAILLNGCRFSVTKNLLKALQSMRKPRTAVLIWIDQICINQEDLQERARQVSIMKHIFNQAHKIYVWLGEGDSQTEKLCAYAKRLRRGSENSPKTALEKILKRRELEKAIKDILQRPWFSRVWVVPEVALARHTTVVCGDSNMTWDTLVRLIRDYRLESAGGFNKHLSLLGNPRQRVAIITQMTSSQKCGRAHTDITQLLILGKSSKATDARDMIYAFYGLTHLTTYPDYSTTPERLFVDIIHMYTSSILWEASYESWHDLTQERKAFQLMSILYSAGKLHQHRQLPSWVPDWTFAWHLAPVWCKSIPNFVTGTGKDDWSSGIRSEYRAGGERLEDFEVKESSGGRHRLRVSALVLDTIINVNEMTPASTPGSSQILSSSPVEGGDMSELPTLRFGRHFFTTFKGYVGLATPGITAGDKIGILLGGDVPVVMRPLPGFDTKRRAFQLLCECYVQSQAVMSGELLSMSWTGSEDIVFI